MSIGFTAASSKKLAKPDTVNANPWFTKNRNTFKSESIGVSSEITPHFKPDNTLYQYFEVLV